VTGRSLWRGSPTAVYTYSLSNGCINYIIYAVYRPNATGQVDKKLLFTILVLTESTARDKKNGPFQPYPQPSLSQTL
jgi:hypothetical protein